MAVVKVDLGNFEPQEYQSVLEGRTVRSGTVPQKENVKLTNENGHRYAYDGNLSPQQGSGPSMTHRLF
jgi:hypothetical protein